MKTDFNLQPTLTNELVILRPLQESDLEDLFDVSSDPKIWDQHPSKERSTREGFTKFFQEAMDTKAAFLILDKKTNEIIGTTRYRLSKESERAIEIGWTFLATKYWGGEYNRSIKKLMLDYAFQKYEVVLFYVDKNNFRSQRAVEKIGGKRISTLDGKVLTIKPHASEIFAIERSDYLISEYLV